MANITIIDSIMGSGKTSWCIDYINQTSGENILYITPFKTEIQRIISSVDRDMVQPINRGHGKMNSLAELLKHDDDIAATHELFRHLDSECQELLRQKSYTLILDEVLNVLEPLDLNKADVNILKESNCITIDSDGMVHWNPAKTNYDTQRYGDVKPLAENNTLICVGDSMLLWRYPPEIFWLFDKVMVLTYLFDASIMSAYFQMYNIHYELKSIRSESGIGLARPQFYLTDYYEPDTKVFQSLINIYDGNLNENFNQKETGLSKSWFESTTHNAKKEKEILKKNMVNYCRNILKAKSDTILWTTYKKFESKMKGAGYSKGFLACNARSTNEYASRYNLMYVVNIYMNPMIVRFLKEQGVDLDTDFMNKYALSEMLQWIWRSRIRNGQNINIYIPSVRMRKLLRQWMQGNCRIKNAA